MTIPIKSPVNFTYQLFLNWNMILLRQTELKNLMCIHGWNFRKVGLYNIHCQNQIIRIISFLFWKLKKQTASGIIYCTTKIFSKFMYVFRNRISARKQLTGYAGQRGSIMSAGKTDSRKSWAGCGCWVNNSCKYPWIYIIWIIIFKLLSSNRTYITIIVVLLVYPISEKNLKSCMPLGVCVCVCVLLDRKHVEGQKSLIIFL